MRLKKEFGVIHGQVAGIQSEPGTSRKLALVRQSNGSLLVLPSALVPWTMSAGNVVSVALDHPAARVMAVVDHTAGKGENLVRTGAYVGSGHWCVLVLSACSMAVMAALSGYSLYVLGPCTLAGWALTTMILETIRLRTAGRVDFLIDREYCRWRKAVQTVPEEQGYFEGSSDA